MPNSLIFILLAVSVITAAFVFKRIRKSQFTVGDTLYWLLFCAVLLLMCIFPRALFWISNTIGFESPSNFIFVFVIFLMLVKIFLMDARISKLEEKLTKIVQKYALDNEKNEK